MSTKNDMVYLFGYNPKSTHYLRSLTPIIVSNLMHGKIISLILIHDGVLGAISNNLFSNNIKMNEIQVYAISPDLKARGIRSDRINEDVKLINYEQLVDILDSTDKIISWI